MPIYEYKCGNCGNFEKIQKFSDQALSQCPRCGEPVERLMSKGVGIVFKGSGFYTTDNKNPQNKVRSLNQERQKDNECLLDGDVKNYADQAESTTEKVSEA